MDEREVLKMKEHNERSRGKRRMTDVRAASSIITTIILSAVLLIILIVASFAATNVLDIQMASTEFEQAKTNMLLLDDVVQDVSLRPGSGGYVQFNQRSGGIGISQQNENVLLTAYALETSVTLNPSGAGTYSEWEVSNRMVDRWNLTNDRDDGTFIFTGTTGTRELQKFDQTTPRPYEINNVTFEIWASSPDVSGNQIKVLLKTRNTEYVDPTVRTVKKDPGGNNPGLIQVVYATNPAFAGSRWTWTDINDLEIGCVASFISAGRTQVCKFDLIVDFTSSDAQATTILNGPYLSTSFVYSGGSRVSAAETTLRGTDSIKVDMTQGLGFARVAQDKGAKIKLDYDRIRIDSETLVDANTVMLQITLITLKLGAMGGSGTVNVKVQNNQTYSRPYILPGNVVTGYVQWTTDLVTRKVPFYSTKYQGNSDVVKTVIMFTTIFIQVSTA